MKKVDSFRFKAYFRKYKWKNTWIKERERERENKKLKSSVSIRFISSLDIDK